MADMTRTEFLATLDKHGLSEETPDGFNYADQFGSYRQWVLPNTANRQRIHAVGESVRHRQYGYPRILDGGVVMITQPLTAVKRGNTRSPDTCNWSHRGCRTQNQYEGVIAHFRRHPAAWVCGDAFKQEQPGQHFKSAFLLSYFDIEGHMCSLWVEGNGRVRYSRDRGAPFADEAAKVVEQYGLFRGGE